MKTTLNALDNPYLENIANQLIKQGALTQLFMTKESERTMLVLAVSSKSDTENIQKSSWITKVSKAFQIDVCILRTSQLEFLRKKGHPFIEFYCHLNNIIFRLEDIQKPASEPWKNFKNKFKILEDKFYNEHDLLQRQINLLINENSTTSVFLAYERIFLFHLEFLEELFLGKFNHNQSLNSLISGLTKRLPEIQKHFVKKSSQVYYLTTLFEKARKTCNDNESMYNTEMFSSLKTVETELYKFVSSRLEYLKKAIKKQTSTQNQLLIPFTKIQKKEPYEQAVEKITTMGKIEEIFLFHQQQCSEICRYYMLLISFHLSNEKIQTITQSLETNFPNQKFILIAHSRLWIQQNVYTHQSFFQNIMSIQNRIYASQEYHPEIHWESPHTKDYPDLWYMHLGANEMIEQYFNLRNHPLEENSSGLELLFSTAFIRLLRTYIFAKLSYLPNHLAARILWNLCVYANPKLQNVEFFFGKFKSR